MLQNIIIQLSLDKISKLFPKFDQARLFLKNATDILLATKTDDEGFVQSGDFSTEAAFI